MSRINYLKIISDITNKASGTYLKYQEYKADPEGFRSKDPQYYIIFEMAGNFIKTYTSENNHKFSTDDNYNLDINKCYEILESNPKDDNETIKSNYKKLVKEYHPDSVASKNLPKGFLEFANRKFNEIHLAYEAIKKERNF